MKKDAGCVANSGTLVAPLAFELALQRELLPRHPSTPSRALGFILLERGKRGKGKGGPVKCAEATYAC